MAFWGCNPAPPTPHIMSTDQTTIDRLRAELAEARAVATKLQATNRELESICGSLRSANQALRTRLTFIQDYARGQDARHKTLQTPPDGVDWGLLFDLVTA